MKLSTDKFMLIGLVILSVAEIVSHWGQAYPDSPGYITTAHFFQGRTALTGAAQFRLLRPTVPFLASILNYFLEIRSSFAIVNLLFWCSGAILMFYFTKRLARDDHAALFSSAVFTSAIPLLLFGDAILTDMAGYLFILLGTYLVIKWDLPHASLQRTSLAGFIMALGILSRESVASVLIFALIWTILSKGSIPRIIIFIAIPIGAALLWSSVVSVSYVTWYTQGGLLYAAAHQQLSPPRRALRLLGSIQYSFGRYPEVLILAALGLIRIRNKDYLKMHLSIWVGAIAIILAWPIIDTAFTFILFPSILPLAGQGLAEAYAIIFKSKLVSTTRPTFRDTKKARLIFVSLVIVAYALITNIVTMGYISFPWKPYTDPSIRRIDIR